MPTHLKPGDPAPDFEALSWDERTLGLSDFVGRSHLVLFFYVRDNTPG